VSALIEYDGTMKIKRTCSSGSEPEVATFVRLIRLLKSSNLSNLFGNHTALVCMVLLLISNVFDSNMLPESKRTQT